MANYGYDYIKQLKQETGLNTSDLLVLSPNNDPFNCGSATQLQMAEWFIGIWNELNLQKGIHLRKVHYKIISNPNAIKHNGMPYENTENDWNYVSLAGKYARYLGLIDPTAFDDRRNPDPIIRGGANPEYEPGWDINELNNWDMPSLVFNKPGELLPIPKPYVFGYDYDTGNQKYHLEVWIEKTTLERELLPVCKELDITYVAGPGFQSITRIVGVLERSKQFNKPVRIFYISDFDPAGDSMPVSVARQIEFWNLKLGLDADIKLIPLALNRDQVNKYKLPRIPIKETDMRKNNFEERRGEGAVELDALEALYPGEMAKILYDATLVYRDTNLELNLINAEREAKSNVLYEWNDIIAPYSLEISKAQTEIESITLNYGDRLKVLNDDLQKELNPIKDRIKPLWHAIQKAIENFYVDIPDRPEAAVNPPSEYGWLFDTKRDFMTQLEYYATHKNGGAR